MSFGDHSNGMVWKRSTAVGIDEDVWDDRALIDAYDMAVKEVNRRLADKSNDLSGTESGDKTATNSWHCGQHCRCVYSEDGIEYEAQIVSINAAADTCLVRYVGYGNEETKSLKELKSSHGKRARSLQFRCADNREVVNSGSDNDLESSSRVRPPLSESHSTPNPNPSPSNQWSIPPMPHSDPMVPPPLPSNLGLPSDEESLASMLMSWYMSGYHTGYYRALTQCRQSSNK